jgi:hypothetical protein
MDYITGILHESLQKEHYFQIESDFTWINCKGKRLSELNSSKDYEEFTNSIDLIKGDILVIKFFKTTTDCYVYLEKIERDNILTFFKTETLISKGLIDCNPKIFRDISLSIKREYKINKILDDKDS